MSELRFLKKHQRFRFPTGRLVYELIGFNSANEACYKPYGVQSEKEFKTNHLTLKVVLI